MDNFWEVIQDRRSIRRFRKDPVPQDQIRKCIAAAHIAPSGGNRKNWRFIVVSSSQKIAKLSDIVEQRMRELETILDSPKARQEFNAYSTKYFTFFREAPTLICVVMKPYDSLTGRILKRIDPRTDYMRIAGIQSVAAAVENLLLSATALGLGTCWMTGPLVARRELERELNIHSPEELFALVPVGYPAVEVTKNPLPHDVGGVIEWI